MIGIEPFVVDVPDAELTDLRSRLGATRWPQTWADPDWSYGVDLGFVRELCAYWADGYDWRAHERRINRFAQYVTTVDGARLHFVHVRSPEPAALPLVMTHGWPGSVVEFLDVIEPLTDPVRFGGVAEDAFHVVCPSIPGYPFSGPTAEPGWNGRRVARAVAELMERLGYPRYGAQGGDWGASISAWLAQLHPDRVVGLHINTVTMTGEEHEGHTGTTLEEQAALERLARWAAQGGGYAAIQNTRPNTIGLGLDDSPAFLCAWLVDKFWDWSDHDGDVLESFSRDQLLTNVSAYWFTRTATSAARLYFESSRSGTNAMGVPYIDVPTGCAIFPAEIATPSRRWAARRYNVVHYRRHERGGHFAALEVPDLFVDDVREFFRLVRARG